MEKRVRESGGREKGNVERGGRKKKEKGENYSLGVVVER